MKVGESYGAMMLLLEAPKFNIRSSRHRHNNRNTDSMDNNLVRNKCRSGPPACGWCQRSKLRRTRLAKEQRVLRSATKGLLPRHPDGL